MSDLAFVIVVLSAMAGLGFGFAGFMVLSRLDREEMARLLENMPMPDRSGRTGLARVEGMASDYLVARARQQLIRVEMIKPSTLARHWRTRPQGRQLIRLGLGTVALCVIVAMADCLIAR